MTPLIRLVISVAILAIIVVLAGLCYVQNGRYQMQDNNTMTTVLDTRTGALHHYNWLTHEWDDTSVPGPK